MDRRDDRRRGGDHLRRRRDQPGLRYVDNAVQANLLAATTQNPEAVNQVYNVAIGDSTTLNALYGELSRLLAPGFPRLAGAGQSVTTFRQAT